MALNDPNPKKGMTLGDLMYATAAIEVDVRELEAAMPAVDVPETEKDCRTRLTIAITSSISVGLRPPTGSSTARPATSTLSAASPIN